MDDATRSAGTGRACTSGRTSSTRRSATPRRTARSRSGARARRLHASRAHVPADDPAGLGRPGALDGRALPVRADLPAPAGRDLRPLRRHARRAGGERLPERHRGRAARHPGLRRRVPDHRLPARGDGRAPGARRVHARSTSRATGATPCSGRCGSGCARRSGSTRSSSWSPRARFPARSSRPAASSTTVISTARRSPTRGAARDEAVRRRGPAVSRRPAHGVMVRRAASLSAGRGSAETSAEGATMSAVSYYTRAASPLGPLLLVGTGGRAHRDLAPVRARSPRPGSGLDRGRGAVRGADPPARRVLRRHAPPVRPPARARRHAVPAAVWRALLRHPLRRDGVLRRARPPDRPAGGGAGGRRRERPEPPVDRGPVPPGHRKRRPAGRIRRGASRQVALLELERRVAGRRRDRAGRGRARCSADREGSARCTTEKRSSGSGGCGKSWEAARAAPVRGAPARVPEPSTGRRRACRASASTRPRTSPTRRTRTSACPASIRSRAAPTPRCTGAGSGRCARSPASGPAPTPTRASAI